MYLKRILSSLKRSQKIIMCDYTKLKPDKDEILQAGLKFLERSREATGEIKRSQDKEMGNQHLNDTEPMRETVQVMLKKAVKENDAFLSHIDNEEDVYCKRHRWRERRRAVCEEDILERDGLLELLGKYSKLMHFRENYSLF